MRGSENVLDDVPVADAIDQQRPSLDTESDQNGSAESSPDVPLEVAASDWQEQRETLGDTGELDEFDR